METSRIFTNKLSEESHQSLNTQEIMVQRMLTAEHDDDPKAQSIAIKVMQSYE